MGSIEDRLAALQDQYKAAPVGGNKFGDDLPEDGTYQAIVDRFDTFESKKGELFLKTEVKIANNARYEGTRVELIHSLENPDKFDFLKKHLRGMGLDPQEINFGVLLTELKGALDVPVEISIKTSNRVNEKATEEAGETVYYRNTYVNRPLGKALPKQDFDHPKTSGIPTDTPAPAAATAEQDSIPFLWDGPRSYEQRYHANR